MTKLKAAEPEVAAGPTEEELAAQAKRERVTRPSLHSSRLRCFLRLTPVSLSQRMTKLKAAEEAEAAMAAEAAATAEAEAKRQRVRR